jgi:hypothetical protein
VSRIEYQIQISAEARERIRLRAHENHCECRGTFDERCPSGKRDEAAAQKGPSEMQVCVKHTKEKREAVAELKWVDAMTATAS